ncbi:carcinoembryonic antigen-related cell adhesion molecule 1-like, partial [Orycteropus afer afer]|uniref:Carcinoembryonic antigen-related cell adhesion molecule 1-like n=1 Tax=Orycteropus afer afer TaxID=1230840 RepID=A0A8B7A050_ORYAF
LVSLLLSWSLPISAQAAIESVPSNVAEGSNVLLLVHNVPPDLHAYNWYNGGDAKDPSLRILTYSIQNQTTSTGPAYSGRETVYNNGSLMIQNITQNDTGIYTLQIVKQSYEVETVTGQFRIYPFLPKPSITSNNSNPVEDQNSVALTCNPETQSTTYQWLRNGQSLPESGRLELSLDNRTLTIHNVTRNDKGPYECATWNPVSANRSDPFTLNISYGPDTPIILPSAPHYLVGATLSLSCQAASNPPAQYFWSISGRYLQSTQVLSVPNINMSDNGNYTCLAYNNATGRNRTTVKTVTVSESLTKPSIHGNNSTVTENEGPLNLTCLTNDTGISIQWIHNGQSLQLTERMALTQDNSTLTINPVRREDAGAYQCEVSNPVSHNRSDLFRLTVNYDPSAPGSSGLSGGAIAGIVIGVLAGVALIGGLVYFLYVRKTGGAGDQREHTEPKASASKHSQDACTANKINETTYSSLNFNGQQPKISTSASPSPTATETIYTEVKKE